ncbi:hypothetical protein SAMN06297164_2108 [Nitrosomonas ureae]|uniref:Uncharacterized protein n=1 Tax=Nitrosomonas ureae TaxID=44577 RepID=A0A286AB79_9PROT|nr:hypothetical protein SAMN06297164_2108 [Nitrosomonas ureae]
MVITSYILPPKISARYVNYLVSFQSVQLGFYGQVSTGVNNQGRDQLILGKPVR